jgi:hypothetical protein
MAVTPAVAPIAPTAAHPARIPRIMFHSARPLCVSAWSFVLGRSEQVCPAKAMQGCLVVDC